MKNINKVMLIIALILSFSACNSTKNTLSPMTKDVEETKEENFPIVENRVLTSLSNRRSFTYHYMSETVMEERFYKNRIPKEYADAFLYYTRNVPELRMSFYSIMVHESANFKVYKRKNTNGSFDLGPSHLNSNNIKNAYFRELYNPKDESHITNVYCFYMVMSLNYFIDMVDKFNGNIMNAYYAYNGGQKAPSIINSKYVPKNKVNYVKNVKSYGNIVSSYVNQFTEELQSYKDKLNDQIASGIEYLNKNSIHYQQYTDVYIVFGDNNQLQMLLVDKSVKYELAMSNLYLVNQINNNVVIDTRRKNYIFKFIKQKALVA